MGPTTIYEYAELIQKRLTKLEEQITKESSSGQPQEFISEICQDLLKEYYTAFDFFEFMTKNRPEVIDEIREKLTIQN